ncbi:hypothetical protein A11A3_09105 [Alcanivorax hongdengensis A-11-3]|uniref:TadE-like protein n=1 Tax=Alcanivorax hongdengensis A-11-3 TaxID=1177179 RepID=L0WBK5_9GAMM|nr:hypothetical protein [Alcanivorax hongdengensis]EKF74346.1 hypothetical protein A11A3_09105 [Alcanivorax hongdengensis A-11-3]
MKRHSRGAVAFEFLFLFPFIVAILYAAGYYSIVFSWQYRMQNLVDRAVSEALYMDRGDLDASELATTIRDRAQQRLAALVQNGLPDSLKDKVGADSACTVDASAIAVVSCTLAMNSATIEGLLPSVSFGMLGDFPPAPPSGISASSQAAF